MCGAISLTQEIARIGPVVVASLLMSLVRRAAHIVDAPPPFIVYQFNLTLAGGGTIRVGESSAFETAISCVAVP